jgi:beta-lactamase superfamily II metal-dependent hydrolase
MRTFAILLLAASSAFAAKNLNIYFIDVEGGQATLIVSPSGKSLLVDAGWPGYSGRDAARIVAAAKKEAGIKKIDYLLVTHHHIDHVGGVAALAERIPIGAFLDGGPNAETDKRAKEMDALYEKALAGAKPTVLKPGDTIPIKGLDIKVVTANGERITAPLKGAGQPNPACDGVARKNDDPSENARSVGFILTYGKFKFVDLADLTWNKELDLVCPNNLLGNVDVYLTTHHGVDLSNPPPMLHALRPKVAIMNNGAKKGGSPAAWTVIRNSPGLEDLWQLHFAVAGGKETNSPDTFIANLDPACEGKWLHLSVTSSGEYSVANSRNKYVKTYR